MTHLAYFIKSLFIILIFLLLSCQRQTESFMNHINVIPLPVSSNEVNDHFNLNNRTQIVISPSETKYLGNLTKFLNDLVVNAIGARLEVSSEKNPDTQIILRLNKQLDLGDEGYHLLITKKHIIIESEAPNGVFYGIQTFRQLLPVEKSQSNVLISGVEIYDYPRFVWRGLHLDVSRHFMPPEFIKKYLDYMAMHKLNTFHWHLTDDQGWRIEIKKYPKLTEVGAWRDKTLVGHYRDQPHQFDGTRHGGFYSHEEIRKIVDYAGERFITIVPEIELPGHAQAAIAAFPELGVTGGPINVRRIWGISPYIFNVEETTFDFLKNVFQEVISLFPGDFIHIGGDEAIKEQWETSDKIQKKIEKLGLNDEHELQSWFIQRIDSFLTSHNKRLIGWDEILEGGLAPNATVMSWRGEKGGIEAAKSGHDVVMTPTEYCYFDYYQANPADEPLAIGGFLPLKKVYEYDPIPKILSESEAEHILGVQANVWTEYLNSPKKVEYMVFPRIAAIAEVAWTDPGNKDWEDFKKRIKFMTSYYSEMDINFSRSALLE